MLDLVAKSLVSKGLSYYTIKGDVSPKKRCEMVEDFNSNPSSPPVMLVSLRAGGVGLNLTGASNLFIMDLHWLVDCTNRDRLYYANRLVGGRGGVYYDETRNCKPVYT